MSITRRLRSRLDALDPSTKRRLYRIAEGVGLPRLKRGLQPAVWGSLRRRSPFTDGLVPRGTPIVAHYSNRFFEQHRDEIGGDVLETAGSGLARRLSPAVASVEVIGTAVEDDEITIYGELDADRLLPEASFQTALVPVALGSTGDLRQAIANIVASLVPGGVLLATLPVVGPVARDGMEGERWHVPPAALERIARAACPGAEVSVEALGCLPGQVAATLGLSAEDLREHELGTDDACFPVVTGLRIVHP